MSEGNKKNKKEGFSGQLGFVLAAAGSAVGVGNIWRFPYLVAKDGGGLFLLIYIILVCILGFVLLANDLAIGRRTQKHALQAFGEINRKWDFLGKLTFVAPLIIITYYPVIGGWLLKYSFEFLIGNGEKLTDSSFFVSFLKSPYDSIIWTLVFFLMTAFITFFRVEDGVEKASKVIMPFLFLLTIGLAIYTIGLKYTDSSGITRNAIDGLKIYFCPDFSNLSFKRILEIMLDAMSQLFFSLSVSMGIMITFGAYVKKDVNMDNSIKQIELCDTGIALIAGSIVIPAVYVFLGRDAMSSGAGLMFMTLPNIFSAMKTSGRIIAILFFLMVTFAALTSCVSIMETIVANFMKLFNISRKKVSLIAILFISVALVIICMGYNKLYFELKLPNGQTAQLLDLVDYISNSCLMPLICLLTCIFVGWVVKPKFIIEEMEFNNNKFRRKKLYEIIVKYIAPIIMLILFVESMGLLNLFVR